MTYKLEIQYWYPWTFICVKNILPCELCKPKISYFCFTIVHKNISYLKISMNNILFSKIKQTLENIFDDWCCLVFVKVSLFSESWFEVTFITELGNDVAVTIASKYFKTFKDIGVAQLLEYIDLWEKKFLKFFTFQGLELYYFNGNNFLLIKEDLLVS